MESENVKRNNNVTNSASWRQKGNEFYHKATENVADVIRRSRLEEAVKCYNQAIQNACNDDEKASGLKNLAKATLKTASLSMTMAMGDGREMIEYYFTEAVKNTSQAYIFGHRSKDREWLEEILSSCMESMTLAMDYERDFELESRSKNVFRWIRCLPDDLNKGLFYIELAQIHFHIAVDALEKQDHKKALYELHECYFPTEEAQKFATDDPFLQTEVDVMRSDVWMHMCVAESQQARNTGDHYLEVALKDVEELNMDLIWEVADWYKKAILQAQELDVENEAIAYSRLGRFYGNVLKLKYKAKEYYTRCLELSQSLYPKIFTTFDWYQECVQTLERYQQETINRDDEAQQKEREESLKGFASELQMLEEHSKKNTGYADFLKFVYTTFPPKNPKDKLPEGIDKLEYPAMKKIYQKAILHYHPDRQAAEHGKGWKFFANEITKKLNVRYDQLKG